MPLQVLSFLLLCSLIVVPASGQGLVECCQQFQGFDQNNDGVVEIDSIELLHDQGQGERLELMLVEDRLLTELERAEDLSPLLARWASDLAGEGARAVVLKVDLGESDLHQDGRYILALRAFLRRLHSQQRIHSVVLTGHFPDAMLLRTVNWRKKKSLTLHKKTEAQKSYKNARHVRRVAELVAHKADIILADLDGDWESHYTQARTPVENTLAVFDGKIPREGGACLDVQVTHREWEDFFHVVDGGIEVAPPSDDQQGPTVRLLNEDRDHEVSTADAAVSDGKRKNAIAQPDILVSRVDARGVALSPRTDVQGASGKRMLDADGRPQSVEFTSKKETPHWFNGVWRHDPVLERKLLAEFFDRNHAYRTGESEVAWRPSSIACELRSGYRSMVRAADDWDQQDRKRADVKGRPTLVQFVDWMQYPAILRTVRAHSNPVSSRFRKTSWKALDESLAGPAWSWTRRGNRLEPSLKAACGNGALNFFLLRSLWENNQVASEPAFYHHIGCEGISPQGASKWGYTHPRYGQRQGAEALMFYGNGLALVGRAKVYYDEPRGFAERLRAGATFGEAWAYYFRVEARSPGGGDVGRKRAYFWSVLGDCTLKLSTAAPKGERGEEIGG